MNVVQSIITAALATTTLCAQAADDAALQWLSYEGGDGVGAGKHVVFLAAEQETAPSSPCR